MPPKSAANFQPKDMVLAKMTGFPAWPSFVMPPEMISDSIMRAKKKTANICVIFIPDGDFNWMNEKSLEALTPEKLKSKISKLPKDKQKPKPRKNGARTNNVAEALVAADGLDFDEFMEELADGKDATNDEEDEEIEDDAMDVDSEQEKDTKITKRSLPMVSDDEEVEPENGNGTAERETASEPIASKGKSTEKHGQTKSIDGSLSKRPRRETTNGNKRSSGSLDVESAPETNGKHKLKKDNGAASPKAMSEKDRQHHFWLCRVKLQRSLIQRNQSATPKDPKQFPPPSVDELSFARLILNRLDLYPVNVELLRETKIHKVLKCILKDEDLAYPDSFRLHEKCEELLKKWKEPIDQLKNEKQSKSDTRGTSKLLKEEDDSLLDAASAPLAPSSSATANTEVSAPVESK